MMQDKRTFPTSIRATVTRLQIGLQPVEASLARHGWLLALLFALPALIPLLRAGFFASDDGLIHVYRISGLADAWQHGVLYPRLFPQFGFGYGQAVLNFYAPLSYLPGAFLAVLGVSPAAGAEWTIALGFVLAALAAYGMGKYLWGTAGGVLAAVVYTYFPYHLADAYLRGALPEHMAFIFPPLIIWATVATFREEHPVARYLWGCLAWAGLVYTHNLTVLLVAPAWIALVLLLALTTGKWRRFWGAAGSVALAAALSSWVWLPFLAENKYVGIGLGASDGWKQHLAPLSQLIQTLPLYQYRVAHGVGLAEHPLAWPSALLAFVVLLVLFLRMRRGRAVAGGSLAVFGLLLAAVAVLMTAQPSSPVWGALQPVLGQLQYPWRFMVLAALGLTLAAGAAFGGSTTTPRTAPSSLHAYAFGALAALVGLSFALNGLPRVPSQQLEITPAQAWGDARMWAEDAANGQVGATWTGEFLPRTVQEQRWALGRPLEAAKDGPPLSPAPEVTLSTIGYEKLTLRFAANPPGQVRLHQFNLPAWRAWVDGAAQTPFASGELGLVTLDVPAGAKTVSFRFGPTRPVMAAGVIVFIGALSWMLLAFGHRIHARPGHGTALAVVGPLLMLLVAVLLVNGAGVGAQTWTATPVHATEGDVAQLIGYDVSPAKAERGLDVTLYWFALRETSQNYKVFVHLLGPDGQVIAQHDGDPVGGYSPTTRWKQGELIADTHRLELDDKVRPGQYQLRAGMYEIRPGESPAVRNLSVMPPTEDQRIVLGTVAVQ